MSRLDSVIRRLRAQRACLERAVELIRQVPGPVLELGLGAGRTFDHLRELCPERRIFVFEREVAAHPDCVPDAAHLLLGDIHETLPAAARRFAGTVALIHSDIGTGDERLNGRLARFVSSHVAGLLCPGGVVVSDQTLANPGLRALPLPPDVRPGRYFMFQAPTP